ncbi:MAG: serine hydrolase domain-containing protein, partial [Bacteroidota bacterium]
RLLVLLLLFTLPCFSQSSVTRAKVKALADELYAHRSNDTPGAQVLVMQKGEVLFTGHYGLANLEHQVPVTENTVFDLASIAKMFTGYAIASLAEAGKLDVDADIRTYLPNFPGLGHTITVKHLLHHTSGIRNWTNLIYNAAWSSRDRITYENLRHLIYAQKGLDFTPGSRYQYSNSGYVLLAQIVEEVSGTTFQDWLKKHVFTPLEMESTLFNHSPAQIIPHLAQGYYVDNEGREARDYNNTAALGSSSLISNAKDMQKWMAFLLHPPADKQGTVRRMFSTSPLNNGETNTYAYGIDMDEYRGTSYITHSGSWVSHTSYLLLLPEHDAAIFLAHNFRTYNRPIANELADLFLPTKEEAQETEGTTEVFVEAKVDSNLMEEYTGLYKLGPGWYLNITHEEGYLFTESTSEPKFIMLPINDTTFLVPAYNNRTITFLRNKAGKIDALNYNEQRRERAPANEFHSQLSNVAPLLGTYYSHELGLLYEFTHQDNLLKAFNVKTGALTVAQLEDDLYFVDGVLSKILFHRDANNVVTGFTMTNSRKEMRWTFAKAK